MMEYEVSRECSTHRRDEKCIYSIWLFFLGPFQLGKGGSGKGGTKVEVLLLCVASENALGQMNVFIIFEPW
jgi:hypothetical protein